MTDDLVLSGADTGGTTLLSGDPPPSATLVISVAQPQDGTQAPPGTVSDALQFVETLVATNLAGTPHHGATTTQVDIGATATVVSWIADVDCRLTGMALTGEGDCTWHLLIDAEVADLGQLSGRAKDAHLALPSAVAVTAGQTLVLTALCAGIGPCMYEGVIYTEATQ